VRRRRRHFRLVFRVARLIRPDITGNAEHAGAVLARKVLKRLDRGHTHAQVRAWVSADKQYYRYGALVTQAMLVLLAEPVRARVAHEVHPCSLHNSVEALCCGDCHTWSQAEVAVGRSGQPFDRKDYQVADVDADVAERALA
jgi:hypothetical protein